MYDICLTTSLPTDFGSVRLAGHIKADFLPIFHIFSSSIQTLVLISKMHCV